MAVLSGTKKGTEDGFQPHRAKTPAFSVQIPKRCRNWGENGEIGAKIFKATMRS